MEQFEWTKEDQKELERLMSFYYVTQKEKDRGKGKLTKERTLNRKAARKEKRQWLNY